MIRTQVSLPEDGYDLARHPDQPLTLVAAPDLRLMAEPRAHTCWPTDRRSGLSGVPLVIHQY